MKVKPDKCRLVLSDSNVKTINVGKSIIKSTKKEKRLGFFTFENKFYILKSISYRKFMIRGKLKTSCTATHSSLYGSPKK